MLKATRKLYSSNKSSSGIKSLDSFFISDINVISISIVAIRVFSLLLRVTETVLQYLHSLYHITCRAVDFPP